MSLNTVNLFFYWISTMTLYREQFYNNVFNNFKDDTIASAIR